MILTIDVFAFQFNHTNLQLQLFNLKMQGVALGNRDQIEYIIETRCFDTVQNMHSIVTKGKTEILIPGY